MKILCPFQVGDRVQAQGWPECTVIAVRDEGKNIGFDYKYDEPFNLGSRIGTSVGGTCFPQGYGTYWLLARPESFTADLIQALAPFADFYVAWLKQPVRGVGDDLYKIHAGTEYETTIRLSHCRAAHVALEKTNK